MLSTYLDLIWMKKNIGIRAQINEIASSWNFMITASWLLVYGIFFGTILAVQYSVSVVELYVARDHLIIILFSVLSVILIHDAVNHNQE